MKVIFSLQMQLSGTSRSRAIPRSCPPGKTCKPRLSSLPPRRTPGTTITGRKRSVCGSCRRSRAISTRYYGAHRASRKGTNMTVKHRPEMIPKPYRNKGMPCALSAIPPDFETRLTGQKIPENDTGNIQIYRRYRHTRRNGRKERHPCHE